MNAINMSTKVLNSEFTTWDWIKNAIDKFEKHIEKQVEQLVLNSGNMDLPLSSANGERCLDFNLDTLDYYIDRRTNISKKMPIIMPIHSTNKVVKSDHYIIQMYNCNYDSDCKFCDMV